MPLYCRSREIFAVVVSNVSLHSSNIAGFGDTLEARLRGSRTEFLWHQSKSNGAVLLYKLVKAWITQRSVRQIRRNRNQMTEWNRLCHSSKSLILRGSFTFCQTTSLSLPGNVQLSGILSMIFSHSAPKALPYASTSTENGGPPFLFPSIGQQTVIR